MHVSPITIKVTEAKITTESGAAVGDENLIDEESGVFKVNYTFEIQNRGEKRVITKDLESLKELFNSLDVIFPGQQALVASKDIFAVHRPSILYQKYNTDL